MNLHAFLETKPLFYDEIDYSRMPKAYERIASHYTLPKIIHLVGTNGKGTTGRFLAHMLRANGLHVGHYTSPHILHFNERIWLDGSDVDEVSLEKAHHKLLSWLDPVVAQSLSYFEYTTLLAMVVFSPLCDFVVLEAGLGGEFDATNVFPKCLSIITPIGLDHQAFLGETIEEIAQTKINSATGMIVLAKQYDAKIVPIAHAKSQAFQSQLYEVETFFDKPHLEALTGYGMKHQLPLYLQENFKTALCALTILGYDCDLATFSPTILQGRCQRILPNVIIDVGHNVMAAKALVESLGEKKVFLVYNSYKDKDFKTILEVLKPIIEAILVIEIESPRAADQADLYDVAKTLALPISSFEAIQSDKEYLVFGSFSVVEAFLKGLCEK
ncbi:bifunctional folylpolyglutamate synthase/dihydrofolate synthase [Sulfurospirillum halorespirans]|uniref:Dihydrofolate synthase/folylpolyglutamate synthase n=1 Tax=Sulfurospirillum halorespirans DSM 13726 TaxID=1193502 RepID=A0A1D7TL94_9BACT|nr:bifunctional folylpolyglutamate synthase/dihydrofolate synthase [Sulfurospirillum halorespirans]AOO65767.1 tetrahydrofolate synthase [Sulfurospirillum halorespirans DSM 13726]